jgi:hypothetical protein
MSEPDLKRILALFTQWLAREDILPRITEQSAPTLGRRSWPVSCSAGLTRCRRRHIPTLRGLQLAAPPAMTRGSVPHDPAADGVLGHRRPPQSGPAGAYLPGVRQGRLQWSPDHATGGAAAFREARRSGSSGASAAAGYLCPVRVELGRCHHARCVSSPGAYRRVMRSRERKGRGCVGRFLVGR